MLAARYSAPLCQVRDSAVSFSCALTISAEQLRAAHRTFTAWSLGHRLCSVARRYCSGSDLMIERDRTQMDTPDPSLRAQLKRRFLS